MENRDEFLKDSIVEKLKDLQNKVDPFRKETAPDLEMATTDFRRWIGSVFEPIEIAIEDCEEEVRQSIEDQDGATRLFRCTTYLNSINMQLDYISTTVALFPNLSATISSKLNTVITNIKNQLRSISGQIWQLLIKYMHLKEWSIKGSASTPAIANLFSLTGSVDVQITFD